MGTDKFTRVQQVSSLVKKALRSEDKNLITQSIKELEELQKEFNRDTEPFMTDLIDETLETLKHGLSRLATLDVSSFAEVIRKLPDAQNALYCKNKEPMEKIIATLEGFRGNYKDPSINEELEDLIQLAKGEIARYEQMPPELDRERNLDLALKLLREAKKDLEKGDKSKMEKAILDIEELKKDFKDAPNTLVTLADLQEGARLEMTRYGF